MPEGFPRKMWQRVRGWFDANASQITVAFFEDADAEPLAPYQGYLRLWLAEGFLAKPKTCGNQHFPALHGGVSLAFLGSEPAAFTTFSRAPGTWTEPGARLDFPMTPLLPFDGGVVEVEGALYQASTGGPLGTAVDLLGGLLSLMGPPLSAAASIADKVSDGLDAVLAATGAQPVLAVHWSMVAPGGGGNVVRPGHLAVLGTPPNRLAGTLSIEEGRLRLDGGTGPALVSGVDYLLLRVECRTDRDDWRFPELDDLIRQAGGPTSPVRPTPSRPAERRPSPGRGAPPISPPPTGSALPCS